MNCKSINSLVGKSEGRTVIGAASRNICRIIKKKCLEWDLNLLSLDISHNRMIFTPRNLIEIDLM